MVRLVKHIMVDPESHSTIDEARQANRIQTAASDAIIGACEGAVVHVMNGMSESLTVLVLLFLILCSLQHGYPAVDGH